MHSPLHHLNSSGWIRTSSSMKILVILRPFQYYPLRSRMRTTLHPQPQSLPMLCRPHQTSLLQLLAILRVFHSPKLLGRGTHVWITKEKATDEYMVWKDSWLLEGRENVEYRHLEVIRSYFIQHGQDNEVKRFSLHLPILKVGLCGLDSTKMHRTF